MDDSEQIDPTHLTFLCVGERRFLKITVPVIISHQGSSPISLPVGNYEIFRERSIQDHTSVPL